MNGGQVAGPLAGSLAWMLGMVMVFFPLAVRAYGKKASLIPVSGSEPDALSRRHRVRVPDGWRRPTLPCSSCSS